LLLTLLLAAPASSRQQPNATYRDIVASFRQTPNTAIEQMLALPMAAIDDGIAQALRPESAGGWPTRDLLAAAMLHSEPAAYFLTHDDRQAVDQLVRAQRLVTGGLARSESYRWFEREWYAAMFELLRNTPGRVIIDWPAEAQPFVWWEPYVDAVASERRTAENANFRISLDTVSAVPLLNRLRSELIKVLESNPLFLDAALHLGRIEMLLGRDDRAAQQFALAATATRPSTVCLAELFAGALRERRGQFAEAETNYRHALAAFPGAQSAPLALSQLLDRTGRNVEARAVIDRMLDRAAASEVAEPWSIYLLSGHVGLTFLRMEVSQ
jgi:tetratricopeptide (TPR) repeat protein